MNFLAQSLSGQPFKREVYPGSVFALPVAFMFSFSEAPYGMPINFLHYAVISSYADLPKLQTHTSGNFT